MKVVLWSKYHCAFCEQAKALLGQREIRYQEKKIGDGYSKEELLEEIPNARSVPQIIIDGTVIGGFTELRKFLENEAGDSPNGS